MAFKLLLATILSLVLIETTGARIDYAHFCQGDEGYGPCECHDSYSHVIFRCRNLKSADELSKAFEPMKDEGVIRDFQITKSNFSHIPHDLFRGSGTEKLRISQSFMKYLFDDDIGLNDILQQILLYNVQFTGGFDWSVLQNLKSLKLFDFTVSKLKKLPDNLQSMKLPLQVLTLSHNELAEIPPKSFQHFKNLRRLRLNYNVIESISRDIFPSPSILEYLDLSNNKLSSLPEDMFHNFPNLHTVKLHTNLLTKLGKSTMEGVLSALTEFNVARNPLSCDCELAWILKEKQPRHFFGKCQEGADGKYLRDLTAEDFGDCD